MSHTSKESLPSPCESQCGSCSLYPVCLTHGLPAKVLEAFDDILRWPHPLKRGEALITQGRPFTSLYLVRTGSLKQVVWSRDDEKGHVVDFYLPGETVGLEAIGEARHSASVIALETTFVCELPYSRLQDLCELHSQLSAELLLRVSRELRSMQRQLCLLSGRTAEQRLAGFLLELSERFQLRGCSRFRFRLAMSRTDIGSHLGLALETVSRVLGRFQRQGLIEVENREFTIRSLEDLRAISGQITTG
jgi:CRP/FNR family transcriptional regulator, anaerobic regulatory protein